MTSFRNYFRSGVLLCIEKKCNALRETHERNFNDIKEKMGEFTTNITNRLNNFINSHKSIRNNIVEIRNLKLDLVTQKHEIRQVIQEYKTFDEEEKQKIRTSKEKKQEELLPVIKRIGENLNVLASDVERQKDELKEIKHRKTENVSNFECHPKILHLQTQIDG